MALAVQHQAFPPGREAEEIRAFWQAARQKLLLDESWLSALLSQQLPHLTLVSPLPVEQSSGIDHVLAPPAAGGATDGLGGRAGGPDLLRARAGTGSPLPVDAPGALPGGERAGHGWHRQVGAGGQCHASAGRALPGRTLSLAAGCALLRT